jgi:Calcium binding
MPDPVVQAAAREQRITMEVIVDASPEEQAMGWYHSLEDRLHFPFVATCIAERSISSLRVGHEVDVVGMAPKRSASTRWRLVG